MIHEQTDLNVADNSGAKRVRCFRVLKSKKAAQVGDIIIASVKDAEPKGTVKKGEVVKAVIVRTCSYIRRKDGSKLRFDTNSCVIIDDKNNPKGSRIFGPVAREVRERGFIKISSLAPEVI